MHVAKNPFYLGLLARYAKDNKKLPDRHFDLFEHFVQTRAKTDQERLSHLGFIPTELIEQASILAFAMTQESGGLEVNVDKIQELMDNYNEKCGRNSNKIEPLLHSLAYSKLGQITQGETGKPNEFSFVHRRFHEYFCARFLKFNPEITPFENIVNDDRWREVLVLLCEVLPGDYLKTIFDTAKSTLQLGINTDSGTVEHKRAIETIRFLRDGFRSRIDDLPNDIRMICADFIKKQFESKNLLNQNRSLEGLNLVDKESVNSIIELALSNDSQWLKETAIKSCRILPSIPEPISKEIRTHFYNKYLNLRNHQNYSTYAILFSSSPALHSLKSFTRNLLLAMVFQILLYPIIFIYVFFVNVEIFILDIIGLSFSILLFTYMRHIIPFNLLDLNRIIKNRKIKFNTSLFVKHFEIYDDFWVFLPSILFLLNIVYIINIEQNQVSLSLPYGYYRLNLILMPLLIIFNTSFLKSLVSYYPSSIFDLISHIIKKLINFIKSFFQDLFGNLKRMLLNIVRGFVFVSFALLFVALILIWIAFVLETFRNQNYSFTNIYLSHDIIPATLVVITVLLMGLMFIILIIGSSFIFLAFIANFIKVILDQVRIKKLSLSLQNKPSTPDEAIHLLNSFKSDIGKMQFIDELFKWLPIGRNPQILIDEASKHHGHVSEKLYQLAEVWEDSIQES